MVLLGLFSLSVTFNLSNAEQNEEELQLSPEEAAEYPPTVLMGGEQKGTIAAEEVEEIEKLSVKDLEEFEIESALFMYEPIERAPQTKEFEGKTLPDEVQQWLKNASDGDYLIVTQIDVRTAEGVKRGSGVTLQVQE